MSDRTAIHAHGEVGGLALIGGGRKVSPKEVAIEERVQVVATWRAHAVGTARVRIKRTATEVADRRHIQPVGAWRQINVQSGNLDHEFLKTEPAPASISNYRRHCHAAGNQRAAVAFGDALPNFPGRAGNGGTRQIVGEDGCQSPSAAGHVEIVINTGEFAFAQRGVVLVSETVDAIKVPVIPKWAGRTGRTCRRPCWRGCRCRCKRVSSCCRRCWRWRWRSLAARSAIHAHGEVGLADIAR